MVRRGRCQLPSVATYPHPAPRCGTAQTGTSPTSGEDEQEAPGRAGQHPAWALGAHGPPPGIGSGSRELSGSRAPHPNVPGGSPTDSPGSQGLLPRHTRDQSPAEHVLVAGSPVYHSRGPFQGRSYPHRHPGLPTPQQWPCAEPHTPLNTGCPGPCLHLLPYTPSPPSPPPPDAQGDGARAFIRGSHLCLERLQATYVSVL